MSNYIQGVGANGQSKTDLGIQNSLYLNARYNNAGDLSGYGAKLYSNGVNFNIDISSGLQINNGKKLNFGMDGSLTVEGLVQNSSNAVSALTWAAQYGVDNGSENIPATIDPAGKLVRDLRLYGDIKYLRQQNIDMSAHLYNIDNHLGFLDVSLGVLRTDLSNTQMNLLKTSQNLVDLSGQYGQFRDDTNQHFRYVDSSLNAIQSDLITTQGKLLVASQNLVDLSGQYGKFRDDTNLHLGYIDSSLNALQNVLTNQQNQYLAEIDAINNQLLNIDVVEIRNMNQKLASTLTNQSIAINKISSIVKSFGFTNQAFPDVQPNIAFVEGSSSPLQNTSVVQPSNPLYNQYSQAVAGSSTNSAYNQPKYTDILTNFRLDTLKPTNLVLLNNIGQPVAGTVSVRSANKTWYNTHFNFNGLKDGQAIITGTETDPLVPNSPDVLVKIQYYIKTDPTTAYQLLLQPSKSTINTPYSTVAGTQSGSRVDLQTAAPFDGSLSATPVSNANVWVLKQVDGSTANANSSHFMLVNKNVTAYCKNGVPVLYNGSSTGNFADAVSSVVGLTGPF